MSKKVETECHNGLCIQNDSEECEVTKLSVCLKA
jgi:hypothetical protein